jgi:hypothetical protein
VQPEVVQVVVRIGDSVIDHTHIGRAGQYRIGTGPGVELPVALGSLRSFPVLDQGFVFRRPAGFAATLTIDGDEVVVVDSAIPLRRGWRVVLPLGLATLELSVVAAPRVVVPKPRPELRPFAYVAAALVAHLAVWLVAMWTHPLERLAVVVEDIQPRMRVRIEEPPTPPPPPKKDKQKQSAGSAAAQSSQSAEPRTPEQRAIASAEKAGVMGAKGLSDLSMLVPKIDVVKAVNDSIAYDEDAAQAKLFGGGPRFDPSKKKGWGTVASGKYATVSKGRGAGDGYDLEGTVKHPQPDIAMCHAGCRVAGPTAKDIIHHAVDLRLGAIGYCYQRHARKQLTGKLRIDFTIGIDGVVHQPRGSGMPEFQECAAAVIGVIPFDPATAPTVVSYTFAFTPSA